jgi:hypothetical protein
MNAVAAQSFRPDPAEVSVARRFVRTALEGLDIGSEGDDLGHTLILMVSELSTNAVLHARTDFTVKVLIDASHIRIEVSDANSRMPQPCLAPAGATTGRGLAILDGSGLDWGANRHRGGKTVWVQASRLA